MIYTRSGPAVIIIYRSEGNCPILCAFPEDTFNVLLTCITFKSQHEKNLLEEQNEAARLS